MALRYGFFNSINNDRRYDALDMSSIFDGIIEDGVFATIAGVFAVTAGEGMQVTVDSGKAWFDHTWTSNDAKIPLTIEAADITLDRYDAVVLEVNNEESVRANSIKIVKGTVASDPQKPVLTNTELVHQHPLAYVRVVHGATSIGNQYIENVIGTSECPFVTGPLETVPIDSLFVRWEAEFDDWFENVKTQLSGDVAANLQRQIDEVRDLTNEHYEKTLGEETKTLYGLTADATPDDAFRLLKSRIDLISENLAGITFTATYSSGKPVKGLPISGIVDSEGQTVVTDDNGVATGYLNSGSQTISVKNYADLPDYSETIEAVKGEVYTKSHVFTPRNFLKVTATKKLKFSKNVSRVDVTAVGGGGGGGRVYDDYHSGSDSYTVTSAPGGGGGYCVVQESVSFSPDTEYTATVGSGGKGLNDNNDGSASTPILKGGDGGATKFLGITANGGKGGYTTGTHNIGFGGDGNGKGGDPCNVVYDGRSAPGKPGGQGSVLGYSSFTETVRYGGGGGSGAAGAGAVGSGGADFGANGGSELDPNGKNAIANHGGGGGGSVASTSRYTSGNGGSGCIAIRMHLITT